MKLYAYRQDFDLMLMVAKASYANNVPYVEALPPLPKVGAVHKTKTTSAFCPQGGLNSLVTGATRQRQICSVHPVHTSHTWFFPPRRRIKTTDAFLEGNLLSLNTHQSADEKLHTKSGAERAFDQLVCFFSFLHTFFYAMRQAKRCTNPDT